MEAVKRGLCCVGVRGKDSIILGQKKRLHQNYKTLKQLKKFISWVAIYLTIDNNLNMTFSGLNDDARILTNQTRLYC